MRVTRVGVLALIPTGCNTQESLLFFSPGQHPRADPIVIGAVEPALRAEEQES